MHSSESPNGSTPVPINGLCPKTSAPNYLTAFGPPAAPGNIYALTQQYQLSEAAAANGPPYHQNSSLYTYSAQNYGSLDQNAATRRKNATRETTNTLKAWLYEHRKNPYPTKGEKIMLAIITKMTLTQVSTWFANARRRLKKENKMTWEPRNKCNESVEETVDESSSSGSEFGDVSKSELQKTPDESSPVKIEGQTNGSSVIHNNSGSLSQNSFISSVNGSNSGSSAFVDKNGDSSESGVYNETGSLNESNGKTTSSALQASFAYHHSTPMHAPNAYMASYPSLAMQTTTSAVPASSLSLSSTSLSSLHSSSASSSSSSSSASISPASSSSLSSSMSNAASTFRHSMAPTLPHSLAHPFNHSMTPSLVSHASHPSHPHHPHHHSHSNTQAQPHSHHSLPNPMSPYSLLPSYQNDLLFSHPTHHPHPHHSTHPATSNHPPHHQLHPQHHNSGQPSLAHQLGPLSATSYSTNAMNMAAVRHNCLPLSSSSPIVKVESPSYVTSGNSPLTDRNKQDENNNLNANGCDSIVRPEPDLNVETLPINDQIDAQTPKIWSLAQTAIDSNATNGLLSLPVESAKLTSLSNQWTTSQTDAGSAFVMPPPPPPPPTTAASLPLQLIKDSSTASDSAGSIRPALVSSSFAPSLDDIQNCKLGKVAGNNHVSHTLQPSLTSAPIAHCPSYPPEAALPYSNESQPLNGSNTFLGKVFFDYISTGASLDMQPDRNWARIGLI